MKKPLITLATLALGLSLVACAPNASTAPAEPAPETAPTQTTETPTPEPTQHEPQRVEFTDSIIAWSEIDAVLEADNIPVVLLPAVVGATVTVVGIPEGWESVGDAWRAQVFADESGNLVITPGTTYDPYRKGEKDFVNGDQADGSVYVDGKFGFRIEGVRP